MFRHCGEQSRLAACLYGGAVTVVPHDSDGGGDMARVVTAPPPTATPPWLPHRASVPHVYYGKNGEPRPPPRPNGARPPRQSIAHVGSRSVESGTR